MVESPVVEPSIVAMGTSSEESRKLYDGWAINYEKDIRKWGYKLPELSAKLVKENLPSSSACLILDAGAGDGLSGVALRQAGLNNNNRVTIIGVDNSAEMLKIAEERKCYDKVQVVDLQQPLPNETNTFDAVVCIGTLTYLDPTAGTLEEFVRVTKPGGLICYSNRTDKMKAFEEEEKRLEKEGKWKELTKLGPIPYLPHNPEYAEKIQAMIYVYRVSD